MGTSVSKTRSATWVVAPPDPESDVGEVVSGYLAEIGRGRGPALVDELVGRCLEAARRAVATGADVAATLVAAVLDAVGSAASATPAPESRRATEAAGLRVHLERGAAASATRAAAARWVPRIVGSVEGVVDQCGGDAEHVALLTAAMALIDVGGGLDDRFDCGRFGPALVDAVASAGTSVPSEAVAGMRALVDANAAFDRGVELGACGDTAAGINELQGARSLFLEARLPVEASVALVEQARFESEASDDPEPALSHYVEARAVLLGFDRDVEVARADRDLAFAVAHDRRPAAATGLVDAAAEVFERYGLVQDLVLCDVVRACLARMDSRPRAATIHLDSAADRLKSLGLTDRADRVRAVARREESASE